MKILCDVMGVSTSGFYAFLSRKTSKRELSDAGLKPILTKNAAYFKRNELFLWVTANQQANERSWFKGKSGKSL